MIDVQKAYAAPCPDWEGNPQTPRPAVNQRPTSHQSAVWWGLRPLIGQRVWHLKKGAEHKYYSTGRWNRGAMQPEDFDFLGYITGFDDKTDTIALIRHFVDGKEGSFIWTFRDGLNALHRWGGAGVELQAPREEPVFPFGPLPPEHFIAHVSVESVTEKIAGHILASTLHKATQEDIDASVKKYLAGQCDHSCVIDDPSWLYDVRSCFVCGAGLGTV